MKIVTDIKIIDTGDKRYHPFEHTIYHHGPVPEIGYWKDPEAKVIESVTTEMVEGRKFINHEGIEIVIGWDKKIQDLIGLPFETFNNMEKMICDLNLDNIKLKEDISVLKSLTIWQFIKLRWFRRK